MSRQQEVDEVRRRIEIAKRMGGEASFHTTFDS